METQHFVACLRLAHVAIKMGARKPQKCQSPYLNVSGLTEAGADPAETGRDSRSVGVCLVGGFSVAGGDSQRQAVESVPRQRFEGWRTAVCCFCVGWVRLKGQGGRRGLSHASSPDRHE